jgi:hypothetical protein
MSLIKDLKELRGTWVHDDIDTENYCPACKLK